MTEKLSVQDAMAVMLTHMVGRDGNEKIEDTGLLNKARSVLGGHIDALVAIHTPPKHWTRTKSEELCQTVYSGSRREGQNAIAQELLNAQVMGLEMAFHFINRRSGVALSGHTNEVLRKIMRDIDGAITGAKADASRS